MSLFEGELLLIVALNTSDNQEYPKVEYFSFDLHE
jgi:hypothetical protein